MAPIEVCFRGASFGSGTDQPESLILAGRIKDGDTVPVSGGKDGLSIAGELAEAAD